jgi:hypothetical protein
MSIYIKHSGFTKTSIEQNNKKTKNEIKWTGDYDGKMANLHVAINDDGHKENLSMELDNNDLMQMLGIQPVNISLEDRLTNDFFLTQESEPLSVIKKKRKIINKKSKKGNKSKKIDAKKSKKRSVKK